MTHRSTVPRPTRAHTGRKRPEPDFDPREYRLRKFCPSCGDEMEQLKECWWVCPTGHRVRTVRKIA